MQQSSSAIAREQYVESLIAAEQLYPHTHKVAAKPTESENVSPYTTKMEEQ